MIVSVVLTARDGLTTTAACDLPFDEPPAYIWTPCTPDFVPVLNPKQGRVAMVPDFRDHRLYEFEGREGDTGHYKEVPRRGEG